MNIYVHIFVFKLHINLFLSYFQNNYFIVLVFLFSMCRSLIIKIKKCNNLYFYYNIILT